MCCHQQGCSILPFHPFKVSLACSATQGCPSSLPWLHMFPVIILLTEARMLSPRAPNAARLLMWIGLWLASCPRGWGSNRAIHVAGLGPIRSWDRGDLQSAVHVLIAIHSCQGLHSDADAKDLWRCSLPWILLSHRRVQTLTVVTRSLFTLWYTQDWTSPFACWVCMRLELSPTSVQPDHCIRTFCFKMYTLTLERKK